MTNDRDQSGEAEAVRVRYERRGDVGRYSMLQPDVWMTLQERQRAMLRLFTRLAYTELSTLRLLEVGSGTGGNLLEFLRLGFAPEHLAGAELLAERCAQARRVLPSGVALFEGDALAMPIEPASQHIVFASTVFSSLLDEAYQRRLADAMWRWVRPGGGVLWYDFTVDNPGNPDVRGVSLRRVRQLFPEATVQARRVTLAPPLARAATRIHPSLYAAFNLLPLLRTHVLVWLGKPVSPP